MSFSDLRVFHQQTWYIRSAVKKNRKTWRFSESRFPQHLPANHCTDSAGWNQWHQTRTATASQHNNRRGHYNVFHVCPPPCPLARFKVEEIRGWEEVSQWEKPELSDHPCVERNLCSSDLLLSPSDWGNGNGILEKDCQLLEHPAFLGWLHHQNPHQNTHTHQNPNQKLNLEMIWKPLSGFIIIIVLIIFPEHWDVTEIPRQWRRDKTGKPSPKLTLEPLFW